jgi:adenylate cyclase
VTGTVRSTPLDAIPTCFEGEIPSPICTMAADGMPNVTYLSVVQLVDDTHVVLSRQFFNKTDQNTVVEPRAQVQVVEPETGRQFRLDLLYERTETHGPLFERMKTRLDAVSSQEGMTEIFVLVGTDICRVVACEMVPCDFPEPPSERKDPGLDLLHTFGDRIAGATCLEELLESALQACSDLFGYDHGFIMFPDARAERLYTVASHGFEESGAGSEVLIGEGMLGIAAARRQSIRVANMAQELGYSHAVRESFERAGGLAPVETEIPLPGLSGAMSQVVVPLWAFGTMFGVLCFQSEAAGRFRPADEHVAGIVARQLGMAIGLLRAAEQEETEADGPGGEPVLVKHYCEDDSVFLDNEYLIKGVAGRILWRLLQCHQEERRVEFSNKEMRLDPGLDLPDIKDNLEARLILLTRRLEERVDYLRIVRTARGRFRLDVERPLLLQEVAEPH